MIPDAVAMAAYFPFFAIVHSLLADPGFKRRAKRMIGSRFYRWYRLAFTLFALIMIVPFLYILIDLPDKTIYIASWPAYELLAACQVLAAVMLRATLYQTGILYFLGLTGLTHQENEPVLVTDGIYCLVRNPLFLFATLFLWTSPIMTLNLLAFNIMATLYFYLGARHEEKSLKEEFGDLYEDYQQKVPMLLPQLQCRYEQPEKR